jgi:asparagine synthase (glutamine-hydrolysing)
VDGVSCILGFRRLAILDPSPAGHQPMLSPDGRYVLVYNGELYNFRELRSDLESDGVVFRSSGDTEVVLHALARHGPDALRAFNGMFALGFYDVRERRLLLARDHAGIKPLYYMRAPQGLMFASQYDQILAHPWGRAREPEPDRVGIYLRLGYLPAPYAILKDSAALEPGEWISLDADGRTRKGRHFTFPVFRQPDLAGRHAVEAVDAAVTRAVKRQLVSDVPVGIFLSGGIDSPLIAAKASSANAAPLPAITLGVDNSAYDESSEAARYANELGLDHSVHRITADIALSMIDDVARACSEPLDDFSIFPTMLVSKYARERIKVVLSGDGGDELFFGYTGRMTALLRRSRGSRSWRRFSSAALRARDALNGSHNAGETYLRYQSFVPGGWAESLFPDLPPLPVGFDLFENHDDDIERLAQWIRWNEFRGHLTRVLMKVDRASMHNSLEVRVPLLDREVVDTAACVDWRSCIDMRSATGKHPLRCSLRHHTGFQTIVKRGFSVPMSDWLRGPLREPLEHLARNDILGIPIRREVLREQIRRHLLGHEDSAWALWRLLSLSMWEKYHYRGFAYAA